MNLLKNIFSAFTSKKRKSADKDKLEILERKISYQFKDFTYLVEALSHRSYTNLDENKGKHSNERLEFLGDAVLEIIVSNYLFLKYPTKNEGVLTKIRSHWVSKKVIFEIAKHMGLGDFIYLSEAEIKMGGKNRKTILSDAYESVLGAVYLDGGLEAATAFVDYTMFSLLNKLPVFNQFDNFKSELLEFVQAQKLGDLQYKLVHTEGPDHRKQFEIAVYVDDNELGRGSGYSKKVAEQEAAKNSLVLLYESTAE